MEQTKGKGTDTQRQRLMSTWLCRPHRHSHTDRVDIAMSIKRYGRVECVAMAVSIKRHGRVDCVAMAVSTVFPRLGCSILQVDADGHVPLCAEATNFERLLESVEITRRLA